MSQSSSTNRAQGRESGGEIVFAQETELVKKVKKWVEENYFRQIEFAVMSAFGFYNYHAHSTLHLTHELVIMIEFDPSAATRFEHQFRSATATLKETSGATGTELANEMREIAMRAHGGEGEGEKAAVVTVLIRMATGGDRQMEHAVMQNAVRLKAATRDRPMLTHTLDFASYIARSSPGRALAYHPIGREVAAAIRQPGSLVVPPQLQPQQHLSRDELLSLIAAPPICSSLTCASPDSPPFASPFFQFLVEHQIRLTMKFIFRCNHLAAYGHAINALFQSASFVDVFLTEHLLKSGSSSLANIFSAEVMDRFVISVVDLTIDASLTKVESLETLAIRQTLRLLAAHRKTNLPGCFHEWQPYKTLYGLTQLTGHITHLLLFSSTAPSSNLPIELSSETIDRVQHLVDAGELTNPIWRNSAEWKRELSKVLRRLYERVQAAIEKRASETGFAKSYYLLSAACPSPLGLVERVVVDSEPKGLNEVKASDAPSIVTVVDFCRAGGLERVVKDKLVKLNEVGMGAQDVKARAFAKMMLDEVSNVKYAPAEFAAKYAPLEKIYNDMARSTGVSSTASTTQSPSTSKKPPKDKKDKKRKSVEKKLENLSI